MQSASKPLLTDLRWLSRMAWRPAALEVSVWSIWLRITVLRDIYVQMRVMQLLAADEDSG